MPRGLAETKDREGSAENIVAKGGDADVLPFKEHVLIEFIAEDQEVILLGDPGNPFELLSCENPSCRILRIGHHEHSGAWGDAALEILQVELQAVVKVQGVEDRHGLGIEDIVDERRIRRSRANKGLIARLQEVIAGHEDGEHGPRDHVDMVGGCRDSIDPTEFIADHLHHVRIAPVRAVGCPVLPSRP